MPNFEMRLLGRPQLKLNGQTVDINANKALALLYYLAATRHVHSRQALAALLWSDLAEEKARRNLRVELNRLRATFGDYLLGEYETLAFNLNTSHWVDVVRFDELLKTPDLTVQQMQEAIDLYRGPFLEDFHVRDAAFFEEWQATERERLLQAVQRLSLRLIKSCLQQRQYDAAINCVNQLLQREPWLEEGHQHLMRLYALTGQRTEALKQYEILSKVLRAELGADVLPSEETEDLYNDILEEKIRPDVGVATPAISLAPPKPTAPPFQAPAILLHFVGREEELAQLTAGLRQADTAPIYALVGMGGMGKSALAAQVAHALRSDFPDGVLWANVATSDPLDILGAWARDFGYDFSGLSDADNRAAALRGALSDKRVLIILDDVRSGARARPLLVGSAHCATLLTTRDQDVAVALNAKPFRLHELALEAGVRLLARILGEERVAAEPEAAQAICTLLQNLPLAVEITAQRLLSRGRRRLTDMAERLRTVEERLDLSISDRAVRTSFMVSWESLDANLRRTFERLAVFEGRSFSADALATIADLDLYTAEDRLFDLARLSLVSEDAEERYRQHPLLADFAREQLGDNPVPLVSMALYYQHFADQNRTNYVALRPEWDNLMAGMRTAYQLQQWPLVLAYAESLTPAWFTRARYTQARQGYALAQEAAQMLEEEQLFATTLLRRGQACIEQYDFAEAESLLTKSKQIYTNLKDEAGLASVQYHLARIAIELAKYDIAEQLLTQTQQLRQALGDRIGVAATIYQQGLLFYRLGDFAKAKILCEQALVTQETIGDRADSLPTIRLLADIELEQKDYDAAERHCMQALQLSQELQKRGELAATYYGLTVVARFQEKLDKAQEYAEKALELCEWIGDRGFKAVTLYELSRIHAKKLTYKTAIDFGQKSMNLLRELNDNFNLVYILRHLGDVYKASNENKFAVAIWGEALEVAKTQNHPLVDELEQRLLQ